MKTLMMAAAAAVVSAGAALAQSADTVIHAGTLMTRADEAPRSEVSILVRDGKIAEIRDGFVEADGAEIVDLSDRFVMPGLIDSHVHITSELGPTGRIDAVTLSDADWALRGAMHAQRTLEAGFTTVQDVGGRGVDAIFALRDSIARDELPGPRIRAAGQSLSVAGGHGDGRNGYNEVIAAALHDPSICNGADDCRRATREMIMRGADLIKITSTGGVLSNTAAGVNQQFFDDELDAIVDTANSMGRYVTAHAHGKDGIDAALEAGVASIEHGTYLDDESIRLFRENNAYLVPTVLAGATVAEYAEQVDWMTPPQVAKSKQVGPQMLDMLRRAHEGGVKIAFGTDTGVSKHGDNARELGLMVQAGMTPQETLVAATLNAADHLEMADEIGSLEPGKYADLIAVDGDPLSDVTILENVAFVMKGGEVYKSE
ncbi:MULTISPECIES: metal-dependent hydrolase family protein [Euryhalocaulis]|uniref:metal-dependent hydrolase family protein n=1 Tax=Euryhalocaulis TaxID=1712422 RepID=UPI0003B74ADB|nr:MULTISPECIES: amidohydrolase family protein [Euryhalocaulis]MBA4802666.1 amidohydrolase family protein [Euryhalocaulis sp.]